jgi:transcriptional/translational regulatory protein YebC/TACO1
MESAGFLPEAAEITMNASVEVDLDTEQSETMAALIDRLEDLDDVQEVYHNALLDTVNDR